MYYFFSIFSGILIACMVALNGNLTNFHGVYCGTAIIHLVGLISTIIVMLYKKVSFKPNVSISLFLYLGGAVGVGTTLFNNLAFGKISVSAILAIGLLGQTITSLILDTFGLMGMKKQPFSYKKLIGIIVILIGIFFMTLPLKSGCIVPIILSLLSGFTIVAARTINAGFAQKANNLLLSTFYNFVTGLSFSVFLAFILGQNEPLFQEISISPKLYIYAGGIISVAAVSLSSLCTSKVSAFYLTLLSFAGQVFTSVIIDTILVRNFSAKNLIGGIIVTTGLCINLIFEQQESATIAV